MGEMLLNSGAEIKRVEQTINRLGKAYGAERMDVFAITSSIVVTMSFPDGTEITQTRRIEQPAGTDLSRLERLNALSRRCCENGMSIQELAEEMDRIRNEAVSSWYVYLGSVIGAAAFSVFSEEPYRTESRQACLHCLSVSARMCCLLSAPIVSFSICSVLWPRESEYME